MTLELDGSESIKVDRNAMSQFQEDKTHKRATSFGDPNQWEYLNQQEIPNNTNHNRRGHFPYGNSSQAHSVKWNPLGMSLPRQGNPYYTNTHGPVMPAHVNSVGRYSQWNSPSQKNLPNINNAHSQNSNLPQSRVDIKHHPDLPNSISNYVIPGGHPPDYSRIRNNPRDIFRGQLPEKSPPRLNLHANNHSSTIPAMRNPTGRPQSLSAPTKTLISNPLSDLQMLVKNQENKKSQKTELYQQESVDLSAHSDLAKQKESGIEKKDKLLIQNHSDIKEVGSSVNINQTQINKVSNRVEEKKEDELLVKQKEEESVADAPVELTSKSSEQKSGTEISSSMISSNEIKNNLSNLNKSAGKSETSNKETVKDSKSIEDKSIVVEKKEKNISNSQSEVLLDDTRHISLKSDTNEGTESEKNEAITDKGKKVNIAEKKEESLVENESIVKEESFGKEKQNSSKRKAEEDQSNIENKKANLGIETQEESKMVAPAVAEESSDMPTVSSTSAEVRPLPSETIKKTPKKKQNRKSRAFRLSSAQSSSSESQFFNKKFRTSNKDENKKKGRKGVCDAVDRRGPLLHVEGSKESPTSVTVINFPKGDDEDERDKSAVKKQIFNLSRTKHHNELDYRGKSKNYLFSSTLSSRYDAHSTDYTWICVFCKKGPHYNTLGDLFGPYIISKVKEKVNGGNYCDFSGDEKDISDAQKRGGRNKKSIRANNMVEHFQKMSKKLRRTQSNDSSLYGMNVISDDQSGQIRYEVWVHEQCAIWSPNVCLIGSRIMGMQEAIWSSVRTVCSKCGVFGANIGCVFRNCPNRSHYHCAKENEWSFEQETFISTCQVHKLRS